MGSLDIKNSDNRSLKMGAVLESLLAQIAPKSNFMRLFALLKKNVFLYFQKNCDNSLLLK